MVPSKEDYLGKKDLATASEEKPEEFLKWHVIRHILI